MKRVVVTGLGLISSLGIGLEESWKKLIDGETGIDLITSYDTTDQPVRIAGEVKGFEPTDYGIEKKEVKKLARNTQFALVATKMALEDANFKIDETNADDVGVLVSAGVGGIEIMEEQYRTMLEKGPKRISPFTIPAMIVGGTEASVTQFCINSFANMKALSTRNETPKTASRPFSKDRDGFVMGEGAGILILEELESALARGAKIYAEMVGYGETCDANHITAPIETGEGATKAMRIALKDANIPLEDVTYINAHGTSTPTNDVVETRAIKALFGDKAKDLYISSTKGATGHGLGAAGGIEGVIIAKAIAEGIIPPTINLHETEEECDLNYVPNKAIKADVKVAMSNSLGFGGHNSVIVMKKFEK